MRLAERIKKKPVIGWTILGITMVATFLLGLLAASLTERRAEIATLYGSKKVEIKPGDPNSAHWGINYTRQYATWKKSRNMDFKSKHLSNHYHDILEARPAMVILWAGHPFSRDYADPRGHMHAIDDLWTSLRTGTPVEPTDGPQTAACWTCKSPDVIRLMEEMGGEKFSRTKWIALGGEAVNPVGCADCHDPKTMSLTITRQPLQEALQRRGKDVAKATQQEMRSLVCAQCHVEYYFKGEEKYITFPWDKGFTAENMEAYYDELNFSDWTHALSRAPLLKAQHPDYELYILGPHGQSGLSCADCHMPYIAEGGIKYSDHQMASPLKNISSTCQTCHRNSEENLREFVYQRQDNVLEVRNRLEAELAKAHIMAKMAWDNGATEKEMAETLKLIRQAQWRWDFSVASHGASFHATAEVLRLMAHSLDRAMQAQLNLQKILIAYGVTDIKMPDISTKELAQAYIGLDMPKLRAAKKEWLEGTAKKVRKQAF